MYFLMLLCNTLLRDTKDTLLVTSRAGVEAIPILKSWVVIPASFLYFIVYYRLSLWLSPRQMFATTLLVFNLFYLSFACILYPMHRQLVPLEASAWLNHNLPANAKPMQLLLENWLLGLYYVVCELWASVVCQFMFWKVANEVVSVDRAKSIYPLIGACGNLGMVVAGHMLREFANERDVVAAHAYLRIKSVKTKALKASVQAGAFEDSVGYSVFSEWLLPFTGTKMEPVDQAWQGTLLGISFLMILSSLVVVACYDAVHDRELEKDENLFLDFEPEKWSPGASPRMKKRSSSSIVGNAQEGLEMGLAETKRERGAASMNRQTRVESAGSLKKKRQPKMSMCEGFRLLLQSTPLRSAAVLVVSYGISISLVEISWKGQVKRSLGNPNDYSRFMGSFWQITGLVSMGFMLIGRVVLQKIGYAAAVLFTPVSLAIAGSMFFVVSIMQDILVDSNGVDVARSTPWPAYFGGAAVLFAKAAKYAFFDATKEIIFIPLDAHSKNVGKAAIDVVAYRLSKSGGSVLLQLVILVFGSISTSAGCIPIAIAFGVIVVAWIRAAHDANRFILRATPGENPEKEFHVV